MNIQEVENVFGTISPVINIEKKGNWVPVIILMVVVGVGVAVLLNNQPKIYYKEDVI